MATELYTRGVIVFLSVLEAQRSLFASEEQLIISEKNLSANLVALYKALGGGWERELSH
jgi:outer membrane protein TolC